MNTCPRFGGGFFCGTSSAPKVEDLLIRGRPTDKPGGKRWSGPKSIFVKPNISGMPQIPFRHPSSGSDVFSLQSGISLSPRQPTNSVIVRRDHWYGDPVPAPLGADANYSLWYIMVTGQTRPRIVLYRDLDTPCLMADYWHKERPVLVSAFAGVLNAPELSLLAQTEFPAGAPKNSLLEFGGCTGEWRDPAPLALLVLAPEEPFPCRIPCNQGIYTRRQVRSGLLRAPDSPE